MCTIFQTIASADVSVLMPSSNLFNNLYADHTWQVHAIYQQYLRFGNQPSFSKLTKFSYDVLIEYMKKYLFLGKETEKKLNVLKPD